jgi:SHS2 domain-containing protein
VREAAVEVLEHPGEVRLRVCAATLPEVVVAAGRALAELELGRAPEAAAGPWREFVVQGRDSEARLVHWLNELIYCAEADRWVAAEFVAETTETEWRIRARGISVDRAPSQVKAATFHGLHVRALSDGVEAEIVLDV